MGKIKTSKGTIRYRMVPLYPGVKIIDREISAENLLLLKAVLDRNAIPFTLIAGTLLGAVREEDFIAHDEDVDLALLSEDKERLFDALPEVIEAGFTIARYNRRGVLSVMRRGEYIDLYLFRPIGNGRRSCDGWIVLEEHLTDVAPFCFKGAEYLAPRAYEDYLVTEYGPNWRTPVVWNNYQMPAWRRALFCLKEHLKEWLPDALYFRLARRAERRYEARCEARLKRYFEIKNKQ